MNESRGKNADHAESNFLFVLGGILAFLGFVYPGWIWVLSTPGDVEMISLVVITAVGAIGVLIIAVAAFKRFREGNPKDTVS